MRRISVFLLLSIVFVAGVCFSSTESTTDEVFLQDGVEIPVILPEYWHSFGRSLRLGGAARAVWHAVSDADVVSRFAHNEAFIAGSHLYYPEGAIADHHPLVMWVVHGTWAQESNEYRDKNDPVFKDIMGFAAQLAERQKRPIELVSFVWSGQDAHEARRAAGSKLRMIAESFYSHACGYGPHWAFGHSHGVNVVLIASQEASFEGIISLGAPVFESAYWPLHVHSLYHFYSLSDPWQYAGAMDRRSFRQLLASPGGRAFAGQRGNCLAYNFRVMLDCLEPGHLSLKMVVPSLWRIIDTAQAHYQYHSHFNLNLGNVLQGERAVSVGEKDLHIGIRDKLEAADLIAMVGTNESAGAVVTKLKEEVDYSHRQEKLFAWRYRGRKMSAKSSWWRKVVANWIELDMVISMYMPVFKIGSYKKYSLLNEERV